MRKEDQCFHEHRYHPTKWMLCGSEEGKEAKYSVRERGKWYA
jgi:hypothetical protein